MIMDMIRRTMTILTRNIRIMSTSMNMIMSILTIILVTTVTMRAMRIKRSTIMDILMDMITLVMTVTTKVILMDMIMRFLPGKSEPWKLGILIQMLHPLVETGTQNPL